MDIFYSTLKHGSRIVLHTICFLFIYFSMKFMYNLNRTSSDGRIAPAHFFDVLLGYRRSGRFSRVLDFLSSPQCRGLTRGLSHIGKHGSHI